MPNVIIDNGTSTCKFGWAGESQPLKIIPTLVGRSPTDKFVGESCDKKDNVKISHPIENSVIANWEDMEAVWEKILKAELNADLSSQTVLLTDSIQNSKANREKIAEIMFEKLKCNSICICNQSVLTLYASGRKTGIVVESGEGLTNVVPIIDGFAKKEAVASTKFAGNSVTNYLATLLKENGKNLDEKSLKYVKEKLGLVALESGQFENYPGPDVAYTLPDGTAISLGVERFKCAEAIFNPSLAGSSDDSINDLFSKSVSSLDDELKSTLYKNIVVAGGNTMFPNFIERFEMSLPKSTEFKVWALVDRIIPSWIGGSILGSLEDFKNLSIYKKEYDDKGTSIVEKLK